MDNDPAKPVPSDPQRQKIESPGREAEKPARNRIGRIAGTAREWITTVLAVSAFVLSLPNAYNALNTIDDLAVIVISAPEFEVDVKSNRAILSKDNISLLFSNYGNRPAVVLGVDLIVAKRKYGGYAEETCDGTPLSANTEPLVIKEGETVAKTLQFLPSVQSVPSKEDVSQIRATDEKGLSVPVDRADHEDFFGALCVVFRVATPTTAYDKAEFILKATTYFADGGGADAGEGTRTFETINIRRTTRSVFSRYFDN